MVGDTNFECQLQYCSNKIDSVSPINSYISEIFVLILTFEFSQSHGDLLYLFIYVSA